MPIKFQVDAVAVHFKRRHRAIGIFEMPGQSLAAFASGGHRSTNGSASSDATGASLWPRILLSDSHSAAGAFGAVIVLCGFTAALLLLPVTFGFFSPLVSLNFIQYKFANGALMRHLVEKFELVGVPLNPFINLLVGARIFTVLHRRIGRGSGRRRGGGGFCSGGF